MDAEHGKKHKISDDKGTDSVAQSSNSADLENGVVQKRMKLRKHIIIPVLNRDLTSEKLPLTEYYVLCIRECKMITSILKYLPQMPSSLSHLKRIHNGLILVQPTTDEISNELKESLVWILEKEAEFVKRLVPASKPVTSKQFKWAKTYWPTGFHPNKELEALLDGTFFSNDEHEKIISFYLEAKRVANDAHGCIIVDTKGEIVAAGGSEKKPLRHAVMVAVEKLCKRHSIEGTDVLQYLGTGFDVYLTHEPCAMCAMALVHFRVSRVFFREHRHEGGALESSWRIQEEKSLNHRYKVFRICEVFE